MNKKYVLLSMVTNSSLNKDMFGRELLSLFYNQYQSLSPEFSNFYEPINLPVRNVDEALNYWEDEFYLCRRRNKISGYWHISRDIDNIGGLDFKYTWDKNTDLYSLFKNIISLSQSYYGYVHVFTENQIEPAGAGSAIACFTRGTPGVHLKKGIPNLGWGTYFGEEYVKELNIPLLESHGFKVEKLGEGYTFNVTDNLSDVIDNYDAFDERRKLLKSLFRPELFQKYEAYG